MSINNYILNLLNIKDENIHILRDAREKFRKDRNNSLKKLYEIFEFVNSLVDILMSSYVIETYNKNLAISYNLDRL